MACKTRFTFIIPKGSRLSLKYLLRLLVLRFAIGTIKMTFWKFTLPLINVNLIEHSYSVNPQTQSAIDFLIINITHRHFIVIKAYLAIKVVCYTTNANIADFVLFRCDISQSWEHETPFPDILMQLVCLWGWGKVRCIIMEFMPLP